MNESRGCTQGRRCQLSAQSLQHSNFNHDFYREDALNRATDKRKQGSGAPKEGDVANICISNLGQNRQSSQLREPGPSAYISDWRSYDSQYVPVIARSTNPATAPQVTQNTLRRDCDYHSGSNKVQPPRLVQEPIKLPINDCLDARSWAGSRNPGTPHIQDAHDSRHRNPLTPETLLMHKPRDPLRAIPKLEVRRPSALAAPRG